jgi:hypothetical protein
MREYKVRAPGIDENELEKANRLNIEIEAKCYMTGRQNIGTPEDLKYSPSS